MIRNRWEAIETKYVYYLLVFFLIAGNWVSSGLAKDSFEYKGKEDVTGDGKEDVILLEQSENEELLQLKIGGENQFITVPLADGEDANLSIVDMNEDGVKDILITIQSENNEEVNGFAYSFKNQQQKNLKTPPILNIHTKMLDHYKAEVSI